jgi:hypothetical protein
MLSDVFMKNFVGLKVEIVADFYQKYQEETEVSRITNEAPASIQGFILEVDDHFIYLGKNHTNPTMALKRETVLYIEVIQDKNEYEQLLDEMDIPDGGNQN